MSDGTVSIRPDKVNDTIIVVLDELLTSVSGEALTLPNGPRFKPSSRLAAPFSGSRPRPQPARIPRRAAASGLLRVVRHELEPRRGGLASSSTWTSRSLPL